MLNVMQAYHRCLINNCYQELILSVPFKNYLENNDDVRFFMLVSSAQQISFRIRIYRGDSAPVATDDGKICIYNLPVQFAGKLRHRIELSDQECSACLYFRTSNQDLYNN